MIHFLTILFTWIFISTLYYVLGKLSVHNLDEYQQKDLLGGVIFKMGRELKKMESVLIVCTVIGSVFILFSWYQFFVWMKKRLYIAQEELIFLHDDFIFFAIAFFLALGASFIIFCFLSRIFAQPSTPDKWEKMPMMWQINRIKKRVKRFAVLMNGLLLLMFIIGMTWHTRISNEQIIYCPPGLALPIDIPFEEIGKIEVRLKKVIRRTKSSTTEYLVPAYEIWTKGMIIDIWEDRKLQQENLENLYAATEYFNNNEVFIKVDEIGIMEKVELNKEFSTEKTAKIIAAFSAIRLLSEGSKNLYKIQEKASIDELDLWVDQVEKIQKANFYKASETHDLLKVHLRIKNNRSESYHIRDHMGLYLKDKLGKKYQPILLENTLADKVPQNEESKGSIIFKVPKKNHPFTLHYELDYSKSRIWKVQL